MTRLLTTAIALLLLTSQTFAQTDAKAQEILKGVSAKYRSYKSLSADFKLVIADQKTKKSENQSGSITIKGSQFNLAMKDQTVMSDGKNSWTFLKESNEVQISEAKTDANAITPTTIFTMYERGFKSKFITEKKSGTKTIQMIQLVPEDAKKAFFKIELSIDKKDKYVTEAKVFNKDGNIITYSIAKFNPNVNVTDDLFTFNKVKYPGVEVVDLR